MFHMTAAANGRRVGLGCNGGTVPTSVGPTDVSLPRKGDRPGKPVTLNTFPKTAIRIIEQATLYVISQ